MNRFRPVIFAAALLAFAGLMLAGCNAAGFATQAITGPPEVPAEFELGPRRVVVLVDDPHDLIPGRAMRQQLAGLVGRNLVDAQAVAENDQLIPHSAIDRLRSEDRDFDQLAIDRVGERVDADAVIYVWVDSFQFTGAGGIPDPRASVFVKVIGTESGRRLYPADSARGRPITARVYDTSDQHRTAGGQARLSQELLRQLADGTARLFYPHDAYTPGEPTLRQNASAGL